MIEPFIYEWHELAKRHRLTVKLILQAIVIAIIAGFGPELLCIVMGYGSDISFYQLRFMAAAVPVILITSVISYKKQPILDVTTSSLCIDTDMVTVTRYVTSETGRRFFATWESLIVTAIRLNELHRVIQIDAEWKVSAYHIKKGKPGSFVDFDIRTYPQTFQLTPEAYYEAISYLKIKCPELVSELSDEEYQKAKQFIHKHYEI